MRSVLASATEAKLGSLFVNAQDACVLPLQHTHRMGRWAGLLSPPPQSKLTIPVPKASSMALSSNAAPKPLTCTSSSGSRSLPPRPVSNPALEERHSDNLADYFTKHHSPKHHQLMRPIFLHEPASMKPTPVSKAKPIKNSM
jgi:hypothetical protein